MCKNTNVFTVNSAMKIVYYNEWAGSKRLNWFEFAWISLKYFCFSWFLQGNWHPFKFCSLSSNGPPSSAVCMYNLSDINHVFDESRFKSFDRQDNQWISVENNHKEYFKDVSSFLFAQDCTLSLKRRGIKSRRCGEDTYTGYILGICYRLG